MQKYIGTRLIKSAPMNRADYNTYRGWELPDDENGADEGYLVEYMDGCKPNCENNEDYISWSPEDPHNTYRPTDGMNFGLAIEAVRLGKIVTRKGWNGPNQFIFIVKAADLQNSLKYGYGEYLGEPTVKDALAIKTTSNEVQIGWLASQTDMLSDDWEIVE